MAISIDLMQRIIEDMIDEGSLRRSLLKHGVKPALFHKTLLQYPDLDLNYARAQASLSEIYAEDVIEIADDPLIDPQSARNRMDARRWYASKMKPNKFGDRIDVNLQGTVDVSAALLEAKSRTRKVEEIQPTETIKQLASNTTGCEPVAQNDLEDEDPLGLSDPSKNS